MKKIIFLAILAIATTLCASAEKGDISLGAQFAFASKHSMAGLGAQLQVEPVNNFRWLLSSCTTSRTMDSAPSMPISTCTT